MGCLSNPIEDSPFVYLGVCRGILRLAMLYRISSPSVSDVALSAASRGGGLGARIGCATLHQALRHFEGEVVLEMFRLWTALDSLGFPLGVPIEIDRAPSPLLDLDL